MLQRAAVAAALAGQPRLLVADEPTASLDVTVQAEIVALIRDPCAEHRLAHLGITHDLDVVAELVEHVAVMCAGKLVETASVREVFGRPTHPYTQALLRYIPRLNSTERLRAIEGTVPPPDQLPEGCRFRDRCSYRADQCPSEPALEEDLAGRTVACRKWQDVAGRELARTADTGADAATPD